MAMTKEKADLLYGMAAKEVGTMMTIGKQDVLALIAHFYNTQNGVAFEKDVKVVNTAAHSALHDMGVALVNKYHEMLSVMESLGKPPEGHPIAVLMADARVTIPSAIAVMEANPNPLPAAPLPVAGTPLPDPHADPAAGQGTAAAEGDPAPKPVKIVAAADAAAGTGGPAPADATKTT